MKIQERLLEIEHIISEGVDTIGTSRIMELMGYTNFPNEILQDIDLYSEYLPKVEEIPFTIEQKYLHFLWHTLEKVPICTCVSFSIPFRRLIAKKLFSKCGKDFIAEENVVFNFGQNISIGNDVFFNRGVFLDSKGGIEIGNFVAMTEDVKIFTHSHSESQHSLRSYGKVVIKDFAKIYSNVIILPGVIIGEQALVAAGSIVAKDIPSNTVAAGIPAKVIRERNSDGKSGEDLDHVWLHNKAFQSE